MKRLLILISLCLLAACSQFSTAPTNVPASTPTASPANTPMTPNPAGPWLMLPGPDGLWAYDTLNEQLALVEDRHLLAPQDVTAMPAPRGGRVAYITGQSGIENLTLNIRSLTEAALQEQALIADDRYPAADAEPGDPAIEAVRAIFESTAIAWAPDGGAITFAGILDGPSADLYVLATPGNAPLRLTDSPAQDYQPAWTPDGRRIVFLQKDNFSAESFPSVWIVGADGSDLRQLYEATDSEGETFVGWLDASTLLVHSRQSGCGRANLRGVNVENGSVDVLWPAAFNGVALDEEAGSILIALDTFTSNCSEAEGPGLYLLDGNHGTQSRLNEEEAFLPTWNSAAEVFFARTPTQVLAIRPTGEVIQLPAPEPTLPEANPSGVLVWASGQSGIWLAGLAESQRQVFDQPAFTPAWSLEGETLYFFAEEGLYLALAPAFEPVLIGEGLISGGAFWLRP